MRLASNKLQDIIGFYYTELGTVYNKNEIETLLNLSVGHYLGYSPRDIITRSGSNINQSALIKLYDCCKDLKKNIPLQYILNEAWFYKLKFSVDNHVLIPRPETEELVYIILKENRTPTSFLDVGTGSGCMAIAIKKNSNKSNVSACDVSPEALKIAHENAVNNHTEVTFIEADILQSGALAKKAPESFGVILSNPPYIQISEKKTLEKQVVDQEPHLALFVEGNDPVIFYKKIIDFCKTGLDKKGKLYFELNPLTAERVKAYAVQSGLFEEVKLIKDMSGNVRFLIATKF